MFTPTALDVIAAVESLYEDKLKPFGRIVLRRLGEHAAARAGGVVPRVDTKRLRRVCETCMELIVELEEGGEYSLFLVGRSPLFVDTSSTLDPYPASFWAEVASYFDGLSGQDALLPSGRYACAELLASRGLAFLANRCLGEICHIIALSATRKKILGYANGHMVPFLRSETGLKEHCAAWQQPVCNSKSASRSLPVACWEDARTCLKELLRTAVQEGPGNVPLPNVKRIFLSRFNLELSETALGHSRVYDLLQDERLRDVCSVHKHGNTYIVVPAVPPQIGCASGRQPACAALTCLSTAPMQQMRMALLPLRPLPPPPPIAAPMLALLVPPVPLAPLPSVEMDLKPWAFQQNDSDASTVDGSLDGSSSDDDLSSFVFNPSLDFGDSPFMLDGSVEHGSSFSGMLMSDDEESSFCNGESSMCEATHNELSLVKNTFIHIAASVLLHTGARRRSQSVPKNTRIASSDGSCSPSSPSRRSWADESEDEATTRDSSDTDDDIAACDSGSKTSGKDWQYWSQSWASCDSWNKRGSYRTSSWRRWEPRQPNAGRGF